MNHAYKLDREQSARSLLYSFDRSSELNVKARLLKGYSEDKEGGFRSRLAAAGVFVRFLDEAWKSYESALDGLNDLLAASKKEPLQREVVADPDQSRVRPYLEDCLSFERFGAHQKEEFNLRDLNIDGPFYARGVTMNYRRILFDVVAFPGRRGRRN